jgi:uncharacterized protein
MAEEKHTGNPGNFAEDRAKASRAGQVGGQHSSGNFAKDPERAAEAGRKGGQASHGGTGGHSQPASSQPTGSQSSGSQSSGSRSERDDASTKSGTFADNREKASAAGQKGGHASHRS